MRIFLIITTLVFTSQLIIAQNNDTTFYSVDFDIQPEFPGGEDSLMIYIRKNLRLPESPIQIYGKVFVSFVIDTVGDIKDVEVVRKVDPYLDAEAMRVIKSMPKWKPGTRYGKPINVKLFIPIQFKL